MGGYKGIDNSFQGTNSSAEISGFVDTFANLPSASAHSGKIYFVAQSTGVWLVNRKSLGFYYSNGTTWEICEETDKYAPIVGASFTGPISATNLSGSNTGDETNATILSKIGYTPSNRAGDTFSGDVIAPNINNPSKNIWLFDDFGRNLVSLGNDWSNSIVNGGSAGTATSANPNAFPVGGVLMNTNTSSNGGITLLNWYHFVGLGKLTLECSLRIMTLDVGTTDKCYTYFGSCTVQGTYNFSTGFSIGYNSSYSPNFIAQTMKVGVDNTTISSIPVVADTPYRLKVEITNLTSVKYYVNDTLIATHTTNFHDGLTIAFACLKTRQAGTATTNRVVILDYVSLSYVLNSQR